MVHRIIILLMLPVMLAAQSYKAPNNPRITLSDTIKVALGKQLNVYFNQVCEFDDLTNPYYFEVDCDSGKQYNEYWRYTPLSGTGSFSMTLNVYDIATNLLAGTASTIIDISDTTGGSGTYEILFIGDSKTAWNTGRVVNYTNFLANNSGDITLQTRGTQGSYPYMHEGVSGKTWAWFVDNVSSPFYLGAEKLNFTQYESDSTWSFELVTISLGTNDVFSASELSDAALTAIINYSKEMVDSILNQTSADILIMLPDYGAVEQWIWGNTYGNGLYQYSFKRNMYRYNKSMLTTYDSFAYSSRVYIQVIQIDRTYSYGSSSQAISDYNSTTVNRQSNALHPQNSAFDEWASQVWSWIRHTSE